MSTSPTTWAEGVGEIGLLFSTLFPCMGKMPFLFSFCAFPRCPAPGRLGIADPPPSSVWLAYSWTFFFMIVLSSSPLPNQKP